MIFYYFNSSSATVLSLSYQQSYKLDKIAYLAKAPLLREEVILESNLSKGR